MKITVKVGDMTLTIETEDQPVEIVGLNEQPKEDKAQRKLPIVTAADVDGYFHAPTYTPIRRIGSGRTTEGKRNHCGRCGTHQRRRSPIDGCCPDCRHLTDAEAEHLKINDQCDWCNGDE